MPCLRHNAMPLMPYCYYAELLLRHVFVYADADYCFFAAACFRYILRHFQCRLCRLCPRCFRAAIDADAAIFTRYDAAFRRFMPDIICTDAISYAATPRRYAMLICRLFACFTLMRFSLTFSRRRYRYMLKPHAMPPLYFSRRRL